MFRKFKVMKKKKELKSKGAYPTFKNSNKKKDMPGFEGTMGALESL